MIFKVVLIVLLHKITFANDYNITKEDKLRYLNYATSGALITYGITFWDYSSKTKFHASSEGWFEKDTAHGGADKMGHIYVAYLSTHLYSNTYQYWGYNKEKALLYGVYSSLALTSIMEIADGFGKGYGVSYEDVIANLIGTAFGYYTYKYPWLDEKIDLRVEYPVNPSMFKKDFTTDYENMKYLFALKASGFKLFKNNYLQYLELYGGYYTRNYHWQDNENGKRETYVGIGINLSELLGTKIFKYYQIPNSYLKSN